MMVQITAEQVDRVSKLLYGIPGGAEKALSGAINRGLSTVRAKSGSAISQTYHIGAGTAKSAGNMKVQQANGSHISGSVLFSGNMISLVDFSVGYSQGGLVTASVKKGGNYSELRHAFVANLKYGTRIYERETTARDSSKQLFGPSIAHMIREESVLENVSEAAQNTVNLRLEHEITRILNGYGG